MITTINVELTDRCNKNCWCCTRKKDMNGDMPLEMVARIAKELPSGVVVHLHMNGEPLVYPYFKDAVSLFYRQYVHLTTNGKLLVKKREEVEDVDTVAISVVEDDPESDEQYAIIEEWFRLPRQLTVIKIVGEVDPKRYEKFGAPIVKRSIRDRNYKRKTPPVIPEIGVCHDLLYKPAINRLGEISICVRDDPKRLGVLGNVRDGVRNVIDGHKRTEWIAAHFIGRRDFVPLCEGCEYYGIPS